MNHLAFTFCVIVLWLSITLCPSLSDLRLQDGEIDSENCISTHCFGFESWRKDPHTVLENGLSSELYAEVTLSPVKNAWAWISQVYGKEKMFHSSKVSFLPPVLCTVVCVTPMIWEDIPPCRWWEGGSFISMEPSNRAPQLCPDLILAFLWVPHTSRLLPSHFSICPAFPASKASTSSIHFPFSRLFRVLNSMTMLDCRFPNASFQLFFPQN